MQCKAMATSCRLGLYTSMLGNSGRVPSAGATDIALYTEACLYQQNSSKTNQYFLHAKNIALHTVQIGLLYCWSTDYGDISMSTFF